jgi:hypothetical protein
MISLPDRSMSLAKPCELATREQDAADVLIVLPLL